MRPSQVILELRALGNIYMLQEGEGAQGREWITFLNTSSYIAGGIADGEEGLNYL